MSAAGLLDADAAAATSRFWDVAMGVVIFNPGRRGFTFRATPSQVAGGGGAAGAAGDIASKSSGSWYNHGTPPCLAAALERPPG